MKIAITGKGGTGKTTIAAALALIISRKGAKVLAVDEDPDANLASALGIPEIEQKKIITISRHRALIEERTGVKPEAPGMFKINPEVSDIADTYAYRHSGVNLLVLGAVRSGGGGCACPENTLLRSLVQDLVLYRNEALILDMEPGIEHLGRATARGVEFFLVVVEPGQRSINTFKKISELSKEIGIKKIYIVINKSRGAGDEDFIKTSLPGCEIAAVIPFSDALLLSDRDGLSVLDRIPADINDCFEKLADFILSLTNHR